MSYIALGVGLAGTAASLYGTLSQQKQNQDYGGNQLVQAQQNYILQRNALQKQQELATAGRTDAYGNRISYTPGAGWTTQVTPGTQGVLLGSQGNERQAQTAGGVRSELDAERNFTNRNNAGGAASAVLRELTAGLGRPSLEGVKGRNTVAAATGAGQSTSALVDAIARNALRSGGNPQVTNAALSATGTEGAKNLRISMANADAASPGQYATERDAADRALITKFGPLSDAASGGSATTPTTISSPIDAMVNNAASYGAATSGRNAGAVDAANTGILGVGYNPINYGGAATALTQAVLGYMKNRNPSSDNGGFTGPALPVGQDPSERVTF